MCAAGNPHVRLRLKAAISGYRQLRPLLPRKRTQEDLGLRLPNSRVGRLSKSAGAQK